MIEREDGFYYDREGIRHRCARHEGQYIFVQVTSISEYGIHKDRIPFEEITATVAESTYSLGFEIPQVIDGIATTQIVGSEEAEGIGSQSPTVILETTELAK